MGRGHGGTGKSRPGDGGLMGGDSNYKGKILSVESLVNIQNPEVYKSVKETISRFHSVLGVRQKNVMLAELPSNIGGVHLTVDGKSEGVYLNKSIYKPSTASKKTIADWVKSGYNSGHTTQTNKPVAHILTHELAHATWNNHLIGKRQQAASKEITALYKAWARDKSKKGYGRYAATNVNEFFAETATKAVHGTADKYTTQLKRIIKKYEL